MDTVANTLTSLINAQRVGKKRVAVPYSCFLEQLLMFFQEKGLVGKVRVQKSPRAKLVIALSYDDGEPRIHGVSRLSKPGCREYAKHNEFPYTCQDLGFIVVSTSQGLMDEKTARGKGIGGELICAIW